ncbi:MAG: YfiR family protein [Pirellulales bacterium]|nr:YfiR family protein [Pirellulales bacterium]
MRASVFGDPRHRRPAGRAGRAARALAWTAAILTASSFSAETNAQSPDEQGFISREHKIKAAYLYNIARYVQWPDRAFEHAEAPFVIGVLGVDPINADLERIAQTKTVDNRAIHLARFEQPGDVRPCHILFLSPTISPEDQRAVMRRLAGSHVLFVGQTSEFLDHGGVIDFVIQENKVRLIVALKAAERESLKISSKLLQVAQVVR